MKLEGRRVNVKKGIEEIKRMKTRNGFDKVIMTSHALHEGMIVIDYVFQPNPLLNYTQVASLLTENTKKQLLDIADVIES